MHVCSVSCFRSPTTTAPWTCVLLGLLRLLHILTIVIDFFKQFFDIQIRLPRRPPTFAPSLKGVPSSLFEVTSRLPSIRIAHKIHVADTTEMVLSNIDYSTRPVVPSLLRSKLMKLRTRYPCRHVLCRIPAACKQQWRNKIDIKTLCSH